nr:unnamed protein product [Digitaria exilis]
MQEEAMAEMQKETGTLGRGGVTWTGRKQTPARLVDRHSNTASKAASLTASSHLSRLPRRFPSIGGECVRAGLTVPGGSDEAAGGRRQGLGFAVQTMVGKHRKQASTRLVHHGSTRRCPHKGSFRRRVIDA